MTEASNSVVERARAIKKQDSLQPSEAPAPKEIDIKITGLDKKYVAIPVVTDVLTRLYSLLDGEERLK